WLLKGLSSGVGGPSRRPVTRPTPPTRPSQEHAMTSSKPLFSSLFALTALALTTLTGTARAESMGQPFGQSFGTHDVKAGFSGSPGLIYCTAQELAQATQPTTCAMWGQIGPTAGQCILWNYAVPDCHVDATQAYAKANASGGGYVEVFGNRQ